MELANRQPGVGALTVEISAVASPQSVSLTATVTIPSREFWGRPADDQTPYEREKSAFVRKRPHLRQHFGEFVAMHDGQVAASDKSRNGVLRNFFAKHPAGASVYIGFVGPKPVAQVSAQSFVRRSS